MLAQGTASRVKAAPLATRIGIEAVLPLGVAELLIQRLRVNVSMIHQRGVPAGLRPTLAIDLPGSGIGVRDARHVMLSDASGISGRSLILDSSIARIPAVLTICQTPDRFAILRACSFNSFRRFTSRALSRAAFQWGSSLREAMVPRLPEKVMSSAVSEAR